MDENNINFTDKYLKYKIKYNILKSEMKGGGKKGTVEDNTWNPNHTLLPVPNYIIANKLHDTCIGYLFNRMQQLYKKISNLYTFMHHTKDYEKNAKYYNHKQILINNQPMVGWDCNLGPPLIEKEILDILNGDIQMSDILTNIFKTLVITYSKEWNMFAIRFNTEFLLHKRIQEGEGIESRITFRKYRIQMGKLLNHDLSYIQNKMTINLGLTDLYRHNDLDIMSENYLKK